MSLHERHLLLILALIVSNVEVPQLVHPTNIQLPSQSIQTTHQEQTANGIPPVLVGCNDSQPVSDIVLLQVLLCQILKIPAQATFTLGEARD